MGRSAHARLCLRWCVLLLFPILLAQSAAAQLSVAFSTTQPQCFNLPNGSITATASGAVAPYNYAWSNGATGATITGLVGGTYTVTVTSANSQTLIRSVLLSQPTIVGSTIQANECSTPFVITAMGTGGVPGYNYNWSTGANTATITTPNPGTYCVTITDQNLCGTVNCITVSFVPVNVNVVTNNVTCPGFSNGSVTAVPSGGQPPYQYAWSNGATTQTQTSLPIGTYTVTLTDANGCTATATGTVSSPPAIVLFPAIISNVTCLGFNNGSATVTATGGTGSYSYAWNTTPVQTTQTATNLPAGVYTVTVTDGSGCSKTAMVTISAPPALVVTTTQVNVNCHNFSNGSATAIVTGGTGSYTYAWNTTPVQTTATATGLGAGTYTVVVTDANGCSGTATVIITHPTPILLTTTQTNIDCHNFNNGTATVTATGGTGSYTYAWSTTPVQTTATATGLAAGMYTVTVTDANGCIRTATVLITQPTPIVLTTTQTNLNCHNFNNGTATVTATGGTGAYTYAWNTMPVQTTATATGLAAGTYTVTVTDANGCTRTATVTITQPAPIALTITKNNVDCHGASTGSAMVTPIGGQAPYTYVWSTIPVQTTAAVTNLAAGTYTVTVTDANGCTATGSVIIGQPAPLVLVITESEVSCNGENEGTATVTVSGGTAPYTYAWNTTPVQTTATATGLAAGTYTVTVTDANGCVATASVTIVQPAPIVLTIVQNEIDCHNAGTGSATVNVAGGTAPYTYAWSTTPVQTTATATGLAAGTYTVTVTDANDCTRTATVTITQPNPIVLTTTQTNVDCHNANNGTATVTATGGTGAYTYAWSTTPVQTTATATGLAAGTYTVTVTDANGCTRTATVTITQPNPIVLTTTQTNVDCHNANNGTATVTATGGTGAYTYAWSTTPVQTTATATGLAAGTYTVTVTDANGCTRTATVTITQSSAIVLTVVKTNVDCQGASTGTATVTAAGGTAPYTYLWNTNPTQTTATITGLAAGTYTVTVTDANGCTATASAVIGEPANGLNVIVSTVQITCAGGSNGSATAVASGGTAPYTYAWSSGQNTAAINNLPAGTYTLTVTDANGCQKVSGVSIAAPPAISVIAMAVNTCQNASNGSITVSVSGGTAPYTYAWSSGQTTANLANLPAGTYTLTVTDANSCTATRTVQINNFAQPSCMVEVLSQPTSSGNNGSLRANVTGGTAPYTALWSNGQTGLTISNLGAGAYTVTVTDANGCTTTCSGVLMVPTIICINVTNPGIIGPDQVLCGPGVDADPILSIQDPSGGEGAIEYLWMSSTEDGPFNDQTWTPIPNSNTLSYDPGPIFQTTRFARCVRRENCPFLESNIVTITVSNVAVAEIGGPLIICRNQPSGFFAVGAQPGDVITWNFGIASTPQTATGPQASTSYSSIGTFVIRMWLTRNGCTSYAERNVLVSDGPSCGGGLLPIDVEVMDNALSQVRVSWSMPVQELYTYEVEHAANGQDFTVVGTVSAASGITGQMARFDFMDTASKKGLNYYRVRLLSDSQHAGHSAIGEAIIFGDSKLALLYPNPVTENLMIEILDDFGQEVSLELISVTGVVLQRIAPAAGTKQVQIDFSQYATGAYFLRLRYGKTDVKTMKVLKSF